MKAALAERYQVLVAEEFAKPEWQASYLGVNNTASAMVQKLMADNASLILQNMFGSAMQDVTSYLQQTLQSRRVY